MGLTRIKYSYGWRWRYRGPDGRFQSLTPEMRREFFTPKKWRPKVVKPPERVWRELGGYATERGVTPPGNFRVVRYTEKKPKSKGRGWFRRELGVEAEGAPDSMLRSWARNLISRGDFVYELEEVDMGEVPVGYRFGEWRSELFVKGRKPYVW